MLSFSEKIDAALFHNLHPVIHLLPSIAVFEAFMVFLRSFTRSFVLLQQLAYNASAPIYSFCELANARRATRM